jgi:hypothetical protein
MSRSPKKAGSAPPATTFAMDAREAGAVAGFAAHAVALAPALSRPIFGFTDTRPPVIDGMVGFERRDGRRSGGIDRGAARGR